MGNPTDKRKVARVESVTEIVRCGGGRVSTDLSNALTHVLVDTAGSESAEDCGVPLKRLRQLARAGVPIVRLGYLNEFLLHSPRPDWARFQADLTSRIEFGMNR